VHLEKSKKDCSFNQKKSYIYKVINQVNTMNNLMQNYEMILNTLQKTCSHIKSFEQIRKLKLSNIELMALNLTAEYMIYDTELQLFRAMKENYLENKIERSVYNKRRRKLSSHLEKIQKWLSQQITGMSQIFIVDSTACM